MHRLYIAGDYLTQKSRSTSCLCQPNGSIPAQN